MKPLVKIVDDAALDVLIDRARGGTSGELPAPLIGLVVGRAFDRGYRGGLWVGVWLGAAVGASLAAVAVQIGRWTW
jgi:hypothetical protein